MTCTVLLTGTRAPATLDLARRLRREGLRVIGADSMRFPLGRYSRAFVAHHRVPPPRQERGAFVDAIIKLVKREQVDFLWPTCEEVFYLARARERFAALCQPLFPDSETLHLLHHKLRFAKWTQGVRADISAPESWAAQAAPRDARLIWKPCYSRFASYASTRRPGGLLDGWMAQRFIAGREFCSWAFCVEGEVRVMAQYRCPARAGRGAGCAFEPLWSEAALDFTERAARVLRCTGSLAFDFMESEEDGRIYVLECNPRLTSGIHVLAPELPLASTLEHHTPPMVWPPPQRAAQLLLPTLCARPWLAGSSPDALASPDDPMPAWTQPLAVGEFLRRMLKHRISLLEATTWDIEYNGDAADGDDNDGDSII